MALVNVVNMVGVPESTEAKNAIVFVRISSRELTCAVIGSPFLLSRSVLEYRLKITLGGGQAIVRYLTAVSFTFLLRAFLCSKHCPHSEYDFSSSSPAY